jgi:hypothetical protein
VRPANNLLIMNDLVEAAGVDPASLQESLRLEPWVDRTFAGLHRDLMIMSQRQEETESTSEHPRDTKDEDLDDE